MALQDTRSIALTRTPNDGSCLTAASVGDIRIDKIILPKSGTHVYFVATWVQRTAGCKGEEFVSN